MGLRGVDDGSKASEADSWDERDSGMVEYGEDPIGEEGEEDAR